MEQHPGDPPIRRYPRMAAQYAVSFRRVLPDGGEGPAGFSETQTIGLGGLMFESEYPLERGETLHVEIALGEHTVRAAGTIVYVERRDGRPWQIGVQFTSLGEDDRDALLGVYLQREYRLPPD